MQTLALDQAARVSGWALFDDEDGFLRDYGTIEVKKTLDLPQRLFTFQEEVRKLTNEAVDKELFLAFEDIQLQHGNVQTYSRLAYVQAALLLLVQESDRIVDYGILAPSHWRKVLGGTWGRKRDEQKAHAIEVVEQRFGLTDVSSDAADAICIGLASLQERKEGQMTFGEGLKK